MAPFSLTRRQRLRLRELLTSAEQPRVLRRAQALLWLAQGDSPSDVAERLGVRRQSLYNWARRFRDRHGGNLSERLDDGHRSGRPGTAQGVIEPLIEEVIDGDPRAWGYQAAAWTAPLLQCYLDAAHGIVVSRRSVSAALDRLRIHWKRPRHRLALRPATWRQAKGASNADCESACGPFG
jgi:transposase